MRHSIIIPCRNRWRNVGLCAWSINRSAEACGITDYEIIVVDNGSKQLPWMSLGSRLIVDRSDMPILNKPRLQNIGIESSSGDVLTFLDGDALVDKQWMANIERMYDSTLTRLCYRVRRIPEHYGDLLFINTNREPLLDSWFARYDDWRRLHEGYGLPERNYVGPGVLFGNSHFSIRRDVLGDLRYNEEYVGRGHEDLWFIRELWKRDPEHYRAEIVTDGDQSILNIDSGLGGPDWHVPALAEANRNRYNATWDGMKKRLLDEMSGGNPQNLPADVALEMLEAQIVG